MVSNNRSKPLSWKHGDSVIMQWNQQIKALHHNILLRKNCFSFANAHYSLLLFPPTPFSGQSSQWLSRQHLPFTAQNKHRCKASRVYLPLTEMLKPNDHEMKPCAGIFEGLNTYCSRRCLKISFFEYCELEPGKVLLFLIPRDCWSMFYGKMPLYP